MLFKLLRVDSVNVVLLVHFWISFILSKNRLYPHSRQTHVRNHCQINDDFKHICQQSSWTVWEIIIIFYGNKSSDDVENGCMATQCGARTVI